MLAVIEGVREDARRVGCMVAADRVPVPDAATSQENYLLKKESLIKQTLERAVYQWPVIGMLIHGSCRGNALPF